MNIILHKLQTIQCDTYVHHFCFALIEWVALKWGRGGVGQIFKQIFQKMGIIFFQVSVNIFHVGMIDMY